MTEANVTDYLAKDIRSYTTGLDKHSEAMARHLLEHHVDVALLELLSELLARIANELVDHSIHGHQLPKAVDWLNLPLPVLAFLDAAVHQPLGCDGLATLALHLLDIAEHMALMTFVPELPSLSARSDRSGDAARRVGAARYLRG